MTSNVDSGPATRGSKQAKARRRLAVVLAAGEGTRMRSERPKVLHRVAGRPMLERVLEAAAAVVEGPILTVIGSGADQVRAEIGGERVRWVEQSERLGTGHALAQVESEVQGPGQMLVLSGDVPLIRRRTLAEMLDRATEAWGVMAVASPDERGHLGRVVADPQGGLERIVEAADASPEELALPVINAGIYVLPAPEIFAYLRGLEPRNAQGELYLTDALGAAAAEGKRIVLHHLEDAAEAMGVNSRSELARAHRSLLDRKAEALMRDGVTILEPQRTVIEPEVEIGRDTVIRPGAALLGATRVGAACELGEGAWIRDSQLAEGVTVEPYSVLDQARVGAGCRVGPFARLRPGAVLEAGSRVGNFVEVKNARLGRGAKAGHLTYLGDAEIGEGVNIGAGVITCNYDGESKHRTDIGRGAFIGSDTMLVAPVEVGDEATTGAGSVITQDVPPGALAVERGRQRNIPGWRRRKPPRKD